ncbi:hypothetical protein ORI89_04140 [Sphingobacterium sp. UT-1RO-CII-1]|uniref:hypothetical protein n=1 Tax=Sphingobacterium sp. UT-1RO-CII-1 TaxID=2995225 RepID=UPI00227C444B|nr:hypothetical protein [Sphingobacterium sp. UT-1RO-CII-1]MCY4778830.1 hypothetical protein [Sphingobacterium sp. UT-1RO-CII-1]
MKNLSFLFLLILFSCSKDDTKNDPIPIMDNEVMIELVDSEGNDLLDPNTKAGNPIDIQKITVDFSGNNDSAPNPMTGISPIYEYISSKTFHVKAPKSKGERYKLIFHLYSAYSTSHLLIKWGNGFADDTLTAKMENIDNKEVTCSELYLNDTHVWDKKSNKERLIVLKK